MSNHMHPQNPNRLRMPRRVCSRVMESLVRRGAVVKLEGVDETGSCRLRELLHPEQMPCGDDA